MSPDLFLTLVLAPLGVLVTLYVIWPLLRHPRPEGADAGRPDAGEARLLNREIVTERRAQLDRELALLPPDSNCSEAVTCCRVLKRLPPTAMTR